MRERLGRCDGPEAEAALVCAALPSSRRARGAIDVEAPGGCEAFMGCLYDGP